MLQKYTELFRLMRNERKPLETLKKEQNFKLRQLIHHAYRNIPFYNKKFKAYNIHPDEIQGVDDLQKLPILTKKDITAANPADLIDQRIKDKKQLITLGTSGSSGKPMEFFVNQAYNQLRKAQFLRPYLTNGQGILDKTIWFRSCVERNKPVYQHLGLLRDYQIFAGADIDLQIQMIQKIKPSVMRGYGSVFQLIAAKAQEQNRAIHSPRIIFTDSEMLHPESRKKIERVFNTKIFDVYGSFETENIAYECEQHEGYHMAMDCAVFEFIQAGQPVPPGETGELVFTVLDNFTFPFIRYNIGDLATYSISPCSCGRSFPLMDVVAGRKYDYVINHKGEKISSTTLTGSLWCLGRYIQEFQLVQEQIDLLTILVVPTQQYSEKTDTQIIANLQQYFSRMNIKVQTVAKINREGSGKLKEFKSLIKSPPSDPLIYTGLQERRKINSTL